MRVSLPATAINAALMFAHVYWGAGYLFGPPRFTSSGSLAVAVAWAPGPAWGAWFLAGALLTLAAPWLQRAGSAVLHVLAALPLAAFVVALAAAQITQQSEGWGGLLAFLAAAVFHLVLVRARFSAEAGRA